MGTNDQQNYISVTFGENPYTMSTTTTFNMARGLILLSTIALGLTSAHAQTGSAAPAATASGNAHSSLSGSTLTTYMRITSTTPDEFYGSCTQKGREGWIELLGVQQITNKDVDPTGRPSSNVKAGLLTVEKRIDGATVPLQRALVDGFRSIPKVELMFFTGRMGGPAATGAPEYPYYKIIMENVYVVSSVLDKSSGLSDNNVNRQPGLDMERVTFSAASITWEFDGKTSARHVNEWPK